MAIIIEPSKGKAPQIDDGLYPVICRGVRAVTVDSDAFQNFEKVELNIEVEDLLDEEGEAVTLDPRCNRKWGEKATLYQWALAFGVVASVNESFDAEEFNGRQAMALIETPEDGGWPRVTKFSKRTQKGKSAPPAAQEARAPWEGEAVDADTVSAWWKDILGQGFERVKVIALSKEMFEGRLPGELNADELKGLTDELNSRT